MDTTLFKQQLARNLKSWRTIGIVIAGIALTVFQYQSTFHAGFRIPESAPSFLKYMMLFAPFGTGSGVYTMLMPCFAALLGGMTYSSEKLSGRLTDVLPRSGRTAMLTTSMLSGFVLGGIGGVIPLAANLVFAIIKEPHLSFISGFEPTHMENIQGHLVAVTENKYVLIGMHSWAYPMYKFSQPLLIVFLFILVYVISGLFATIAVGVSYFTRIRYIEILIPFVLSLLWWEADSFSFGLIPAEWSHIIFLDAHVGNTGKQAFDSWIGMGVTFVGSLALSLSLLMLERRRDVR